jgi:hypothetical protein
MSACLSRKRNTLDPSFRYPRWDRTTRPWSRLFPLAETRNSSSGIYWSAATHIDAPPTLVAARGNIFDLEGNDITPTQLAVDGEIKHRQIARIAPDLKFGSDRPDMLRAERRLYLFQGARMIAVAIAFSRSSMVPLLRCREGRACAPQWRLLMSASWGIVLQKSQNAARLIFGQMAEQGAIADQFRLK